MSAHSRDTVNTVTSESHQLVTSHEVAAATTMKHMTNRQKKECNV